MKINSLLFLFSILCVIVSAQDASNIIIDNADRREIYPNDDPPYSKFLGNVRAYHNGTFFYCDSAIYINNTLYAYGDVSVIQDDSISIYGDSLIYDETTSLAEVMGKTVVENGENQLYTEKIVYHIKTQIATYNQNGLLESGSHTVKSKKGRFDLNNNIAHFYEHVSIRGPEFELLNDSVTYDMEKELTSWECPTIITNNDSQIYSEIGQYNLKSKDAIFIQNAQFQDSTTFVSGDTINYIDTIQSFEVIGKANYVSVEDTASAGIIIHNKSLGTTQLISNARYQSKDNLVIGDHILYDKNKGTYNVQGRSSISDPPTLIIGDTIDYNKHTKVGIVVGNAIWKDTTSKIDILCDSMVYKGNEKYAKAIGFNQRPLMISYSSDDSLYISSDTLVRYQIVKNIDSLTIDTSTLLIADNRVKIFSNSYQAICDSLSYQEEDSLFTLIDDPLIWKDTTQMDGDTMFLRMEENKLSSLNIKGNAFIINSPDLYFFNQIRGRIIDVDFKNKKIDQMKVNGNAQSIYYLLDDEDAYIGVNESECSLIIFDFNNGQIDKIRHYTEPSSIIHPMSIDHEKIKFPGFKWNQNLRPLDYKSLRFHP